jgi:pimeloyl-ACP methyl ester carboxylesterase
MRSIVALVSSVALTIPGRAFGGDEARAFDSKGVSIRYTVQGSGEPVVLIHGLFANTQINWGAPGTLKALAKNYQVIALDVRGHGGSGKPKEESAYGIELEEDVVRLLDHLHVKQAHVVGYSMGGMIAMKLLTRHPERVKSAVLGGMGWLREGSALQNVWGRARDHAGAATPAACVRSLGALAVTREEVQAIRVPVTVIVGDRDPVRQLYVVPLQGIRPDWPVQIVPDAGHLNCIIRPRFKEGIQKWLEQQTKR